MINRRQPVVFAAFLLFLTVIACAVPGQGTASAPTPTFDPAQLDAIIAETVAAVLQQTALAPTPAPIVTATGHPEPSFTPTLWPQSSILAQPDGTVLFLDEKAKFNLTIPAGWLPVRIDQMEYYDAFSLPQASIPAMQAALLDINDLDPGVFRLFIFDIQDGHLDSEFVNNINVVWNVDSSIALETEDEIKATAESLPASVPGLVVTSSTVSKTASGIPIGIILSEITSQKADGSEFVLFQKQVILNVEEGVIVLTFTTEQGIKDAILPLFDAIVESVQLGE